MPAICKVLGKPSTTWMEQGDVSRKVKEENVILSFKSFESLVKKATFWTKTFNNMKK